MLEYNFDPRAENVLILGYNTLHLQSSGFIHLMKEKDVDDALDVQLESDIDLIPILNFDDRNTANFIGGGISEEDYFNYIKVNYEEITKKSTQTHLCNSCAIMSKQPFVQNVYLATPVAYAYDLIVSHNFKPVCFDIFNISLIEKCINDNNISSIFVHDVKIVADLVLNFNIKLENFTFFISKLGYNLTEIDGDLVLAELDLYGLAEKFKFRLVIIDIFNGFDLPEDISQ